MNPIQLSDQLARSRATPAFRAAVDEFLRTGRSGPGLAFCAGCPPVKVERTLVKALVEYPDLAVESIEIRAVSGCESFVGELRLRAGDDARLVEFAWDCRWRAEEQGWRDWFGFPDQIRAAREFGWDCFREWVEVEIAAAPPAFRAETEAEAVPA